MRAIALLLGLAALVVTTARADSEVSADAVVATLPFLAADDPNRIDLDVGPEGLVELDFQRAWFA